MSTAPDTAAVALAGQPWPLQLVLSTAPDISAVAMAGQPWPLQLVPSYPVQA